MAIPKSYDFEAAVDNNSIDLPVDYTIIAEVLSDAHDEGEYFWLIQDNIYKDFYVLTGSHDYTGWDCQSNASLSDGFGDISFLPLYIPMYDNQVRPVFDMIVEQYKQHESN